MARFVQAQCGTCSAPIIWTVTAAQGKPAPVDFEPVPNGNIALEARPVGRPVSHVIPPDQREGKTLRLNHFVTCRKPPQRTAKTKTKQPTKRSQTKGGSKDKATKVRDHLFAGDGVPDHIGQERCEVCKLPKRRCPNRLPETPEHIRHAEAARYGD